MSNSLQPNGLKHIRLPCHSLSSGVCSNWCPLSQWCFLFYKFYFYFILLYHTVLVLPYINMNPPRVYMSSQSWTLLPPPTPYHLSGSSPCTSPKHPVSCIKHRLAIHFLHDSIHVSMPFSQIIPLSPSPSESKSSFIFWFHFLFLLWFIGYSSACCSASICWNF